MNTRSTPRGRTAVFTIVAGNYLPYARVLMRSLAEVSPAWDRFVLLADLVDGSFTQADDGFALVEARSLPLPEPEQLFFRYTILELSTAVKPWFFRHLFARGYEHVVYLDPDIFVYAPMREIDDALDAGALTVLVPHLTGRILDSAHPGERDILLSGAYNLGFCAMARHPDLDALLDFWCEKSLREFVADVHSGLFTDQRWMDLVPGMFRDVTILRHDGYDVAYWNLPHRRLARESDRISVNGVPLVFFHFSGIDPLKPEGFSKHQNRYRLVTVGLAADLARRYSAEVRARGLAACRGRAYAYGFLRDGSPIPDVLRRLYRMTPEVELWAGSDPFARSCAEWNEPLDTSWPPLTRVMLAVYQARSDVRLKWPDPMDKDRKPFARWFVDAASLEQTVPACYVDPVRQALENPPTSIGARAHRSSARPITVLPGLVPGALRKAAIALGEGRLPLSPRRWHQLFRMHVAEQAQEALARASPPVPSFEWPRGVGKRKLAAGSAIDPRGSDEMAAGVDGESTPAEINCPALTIVGYLSDATGVATLAHASAAACQDAGIACELIDARPLEPIRGRHRVSLLHVNADQTPAAAIGLGEAFFRDRYTIGVWAWELAQFPDAFLPAFNHVQEVWAPSRFIHEAVAEKSPVPVVHMPFVVTAAPSPGISRQDFGLPEDGFLFLMMYDALSIQERKNPLGALEAFRRAFPNRSGVGMVVRVNHAASRAEDVAIVRQQVASTAGAFLLDRPMSRRDAQSLHLSCDAFVSLHRSEGLGLNIAEAMLLNKPVVVTGWSGNMDFTTQQNACLVDYELVTLSMDYGPYRQGNRWAEPDLDHAAALMVRLVEDTAFRNELAANGRTTIARQFSPHTVGARYLRRVTAIRRWM
jgi:glycosyltransferase involved in cell wall biosynthesis